MYFYKMNSRLIYQKGKIITITIFQIILFLFSFSYSVFSQSPTLQISRTEEQTEWINNNLTQEEIQWLNTHSIIRVNITPNKPFYYNQNGAKGISVDFIEKLSDRTGIKLQYSYNTELWNETLNDFKENKNSDLLLSIKITEDRKSFIEFTKEYIEMPMVIFAHTNADFITGINDLKDKRIAVEQGFWVSEQLKKDYPEIELVIKENTLNALNALAVNKVDAYIGNLVAGTFIINTEGLKNIKVAAPSPYESHNQAMGIRKDWPELASIINKVFDDISVEEKNRIWNKYFNIRFEHGLQIEDILLYAGIASIFILLIFALIIFWNRRLKKEISERERIQENLRDSELRFRALSDSSFEGVIFAENGRILECNKATYKILGYSKKEIIGKKVLNFIVRDYKETVRKKTQTGDETPYEIEAIKKDGTHVPLEIHARMIRYKGGMVRVSVFSDITILKQSEYEKEKHRFEILANKKIIEEDNKRLQELDHKKNKFFSIIAHDLKGPIGTLTNLLGMLQSEEIKEEPEREKKLIDALAKSSKNTLDLIENLLQWSKAEMGGTVLHPEILNLNKQIEYNLELLHENADFKNIKITNLTDPDIYLLSDQNTTNTIFRNLISNAIKFTYELGEIKIYSRQTESGKINICFEDNGIGMNKSTAGKLLQLDSNISTMGTKNELGTGLGLKLCTEFVKLNGGEIWIESIENKGSKFWICLPIFQKT